MGVGRWGQGAAGNLYLIYRLVYNPSNTLTKQLFGEYLQMLHV